MVINENLAKEIGLDNSVVYSVIDNLLLLPSETHFNFHQTSRFFSTFKDVSPDLIRIQKSSTYDVEQLGIYISSICEIKRFFDYKRCFYIVSPTGVKKNRLK